MGVVREGSIREKRRERWGVVRWGGYFESSECVIECVIVTPRTIQHSRNAVLLCSTRGDST